MAVTDPSEGLAKLIQAGSTSVLSLIALVVVLLAFLALYWFRKDSAQTRLTVFFVLLAVGIGFGSAFFLKDYPPHEPPPQTPQQRTPTPVPTLTAATPSTSPSEEDVPGAKLEVWPLPAGFSGDAPPGMSLEPIIDSGILFDMGNYLSEGSFKSLAGSTVGLRWSGFIRIKEKGNYNLEIERDGAGLRNGLWFVLLKVGSQTFVTKYPHAYPGTSDILTQEMQLDPGVARLELFTYSNDVLNFPHFQLRIKLRSENPSLSITLNAESVFHNQPPPPTTPTLTASLPSMSPSEEYIPGAKLEVWPLPAGFSGDAPPGMSLEPIIDSGILFNMGNYLSEGSFKSLAGRIVGLRWSGVILIKEKGNYNLEIERDGAGLRNGLWFVLLKVGDQTFVTKYPHAYKGTSDILTQEMQLESGIARFEIFTYSYDIWGFPHFQMRVKLRSETPSLSITLNAGSVFHKR